MSEYPETDLQIAWCDERIASNLRSDERARKAATLLGVGPTTASAVVASVSDFGQFANARQFGAWLGLTVLTVGIDLAKSVFAVHGVNKAGNADLVRPAVPRDKLHQLRTSLPPCVVGLEACPGAHHWARLFEPSGHTVRLIAPKFLTPYRMSGKRGNNDAADAAAICEAVRRPQMRFVPIKSLDQQSRLMVHRARQGFVEQDSATLNHIRGLLSEFGIVLPLKAATVRRRSCECQEDLTSYASTVICSARCPAGPAKGKSTR